MKRLTVWVLPSPLTSSNAPSSFTLKQEIIVILILVFNARVLTMICLMSRQNINEVFEHVLQDV